MCNKSISKCNWTWKEGVMCTSLLCVYCTVHSWLLICCDMQSPWWRDGHSQWLTATLATCRTSPSSPMSVSTWWSRLRHSGHWGTCAASCSCSTLCLTPTACLAARVSLALLRRTGWRLHEPRSPHCTGALLVPCIPWFPVCVWLPSGHIKTCILR